MELLKHGEEKLSKGDPLDKDWLEEVERTKKELMEVLKSADLEIVGVTKRNVAAPPPTLQEKIVKLNKETTQEIERVINVAGLSSKIEELKVRDSKRLQLWKNRKKWKLRSRTEFLLPWMP